MKPTKDQIEAGARAIGEHRPGHGWERDEETYLHYTQIVEWALTAVLTDIEAKIVKERVGWPNTTYAKGVIDGLTKARAILRGEK